MHSHNIRQTQSEQGLAKSRALTSLNMSGNLLGKMTCWELKLSLMKNRTLRTLNLECNQVPCKEIQTRHPAIIMLANVGGTGLTCTCNVNRFRTTRAFTLPGP
jgi:hypothetical protein